MLTYMSLPTNKNELQSFLSIKNNLGKLPGKKVYKVM